MKWWYFKRFFDFRHSVGDTKVPFCLQSCVKPLEYAIAVHEHGTERIHQYVGMEPSGFKFNKLSLDEEGGWESVIDVCSILFVSARQNFSVYWE